MKINDIKELIQSLDKSSVRYFEMEQPELKLKISKDSNPSTKVENMVESNLVNLNEEQVKIENTEVNTSDSSDDITIVTSPMVGVYYSSASPEADSYVNVGSKVEKGQVLCIIEAMKIMNELVSDSEGEIVEIMVQNEDVIEYGQPIMKIRS